MNILILTPNIGGNAPGIVFERLIFGLSKFHMVDVLTISNKQTIDLPSIHSVEEIQYNEIPEYRQSQLIFIIGLNPCDYLWALKVKRKLRNPRVKYDLILSFVSNGHYAAILSGVMISKTLNTKLAVYSVDAIPAPLGWSKNDIYFKSCKRFISKYISKADLFFAANEKILEYQKTFINNNNIKFDVIYNPAPLELSAFKASESLIFLYTGEIYRVRRVKYLFKALQLLLKEYPNAELHFVGSKIPKEDLQLLDESERSAVKIYPRTIDLNPFYKRSFCLIDIDADIENDVYLSSKITNYIMINRPIICETGMNSPSRQLFSGIPSILQCDHNPEDIYLKMKSIIKNPITDFSDRQRIIDKFSLQNIIQKMNQTLRVFEKCND